MHHDINASISQLLPLYIMGRVGNWGWVIGDGGSKKGERNAK
jgi:hypothetical protein